MAVSVVSGVVTRLSNLLLQEAIYLIDVSDKAHELQTELIRMQFFLKDADARQNESAFIKNSVAEMKDLAYDAEDVIATYALTVASRKGRGIQKVLKRCACILDEGITVHQIGSKIDAIKKKISNLKQSFQEYGIIRESTMQAGGPSSLNEREREQRQTFSHLQHEVVGFDKDLNELVEFLLKEEQGKRIASICDEKEKEKIRKSTNKEIVEKLCEVQKERKCLVILDDIWDVETCNHLLGAFSGNDTKSKILLTSRNEKVHLHVDPGGFLYKLQHLDEARSLELLEKIAISRREDSMARTCMDQLGKEMIGYCGGLPLAITVLGGLLASKQTLGEWQDVLKHANAYLHVEDSRVNHVLALSFISQIQHRGGREDTMDDVGDRYLRELVQRCMVLVGKEGSRGRIKTCRMHDLMRDFCVSKAQDENFLHFTNTLSMKQREAQIGKVRRLAIISESDDSYIKGIKFNEYPYLRSLLHLLPEHHESLFKESCFKKFKLVRVLHLEYFKNHLRKLPKDIGCLIHLRYLSLKRSNINEVPSSIGNLRCLETLDLRINYDTLLDIFNLRVPNVFKYMKQLKHLYLPGRYWVCGKLELANLSYLHTLVNVQPTTIQIPTWFKLNRLRVLKVRNRKYNKRAQDAMQMLISRCPLIENLNLHCRIKRLPETLKFSPNLAKLTLIETWLEEDPMPTLEKLPNLKILRLVFFAFLGENMVCSEGGFPSFNCI
nr:putative disease resistance protein [Quercus suber]